MPRISVPTTARLPSTLRVDPSNPAVAKILNRLSRNSLITVALDWLDDSNLPLAIPYLRRSSNEDDDEDDDDQDFDDFNPPARSLAALRELYTDLQARKGSKREVLDRITEGDWRHGLSLYQLAMADLQYLYDHSTSQKWTAYRIVPLKTSAPQGDDDQLQQQVDKESLVIPRFHPSTFLRSLQETVLPDIKAHYNFDRHKTLPLLLLRIFILDSPYNTNLGTAPTGATNASSSSSSSSSASFDVSRTIYIAFPDASPHIYISKSQTLTTSAASGAGGESKSLRSLILEGIPKALSRPPRHRYALKATNLTTKNLVELLDRRGAARTNSAGGGWSIYTRKLETSPLDFLNPPLSPPLTDSDDEQDGGGVLPQPFNKEAKERERIEKLKERERALDDPVSASDERILKRARLVAKGRFGKSGRIDDGKGVERVDIVVEDAFPSLPEGNSSSTSRKRKRQVEEEEDNGEQDLSTQAGKGKGRKSALDLVLEDEEERGDGDGDESEGTSEEEVAQQLVSRREGVKQEDEWRPNIRLTFHGTHIFAGIRQLVERGIIDGERMPGWMTGEEGVTIGAVRHGRIRGHKGAGL